MEQPKNSILKREHRASVPAELMSLVDVEEKELDDLEEQQRIANVMCDAVDLIGELLLFSACSPCGSDGLLFSNYEWFLSWPTCFEVMENSRISDSEAASRHRLHPEQRAGLGAGSTDRGRVARRRSGEDDALGEGQ